MARTGEKLFLKGYFISIAAAVLLMGLFYAWDRLDGDEPQWPLKLADNAVRSMVSSNGNSINRWIMDDDYDVYNAILADIIENLQMGESLPPVPGHIQPEKGRMILVSSNIIREEWSTFDILRKHIFSDGGISGLFCFNDYIVNNIDTCNLLRTEGLSDSERIIVVSKPNWEDCKGDYPKAIGIINFSRVGFDPIHRHAIVTMYFYCGGLCGGGDMLWLKKSKGKWRISYRINLFVA